MEVITKLLRRILSMLLLILLVNLALDGSVFATNKDNKETEFIEKLQTNIRQQGVGIDSKIKVKLKDGTKIEGFITEFNNKNFVVMDSKSGQSIPVLYPQVKQAKGNNWSTRKTIQIVAIAGLIVIATVIIVALKNDK